MNRKNNEHFQCTDRKIQNDLLEALERKPLAAVTVAEICRAVEINRSSFYLHYQDTFDLMERLCAQKLYSVQRQIEALSKTETDYLQFIRISAQHIYDNQSFYRAYFKSVGAEQYEEHLKHILTASLLPAVQELGSFSEHQIEYHFTFTFNGISAMLRKWLHYGCPETVDEIVALVASSMSAYSDWNQSEKSRRQSGYNLICK